MNVPLKRGACPALSDPMPTGDGLIARLTLADAIRPDVLAGLAEAALAYGNGLMEITQRGNLQFRGLTADSAPLLAEAVSRLGIAMPAGLTVDVGPLAGIDPDEVADPQPIVETIRKAAAPLADRLGPKVSVVVDGRGKIVLDAIQADIRLEAAREQLWRLSVGGRVAGFVAEPSKAALAALHLIAAAGRQARGRDLDESTLQNQLGPLIAAGTAEVPAATAKSTIGMHDLGTAGMALGLGVAFGQVRAEVLRELAGLAGRAIRLAPGRCLLVLGLRDREARTIVTEIDGATASEPLPSLRGEGEGEGLGEACRGGKQNAIEVEQTSPGPSPYLSPPAGRGVVGVAPFAASLVTQPDDRRLFVAACAGSEGCASGHIPARSIGAKLAARAPALLDGSLIVHVSGCAKGCAHPGAALTFTGDAQRAGLVVQGTASASPTKHLAANEIVAEAERLSKLINQNRRSGETAAACLARLKPGNRSERAA